MKTTAFPAHLQPTVCFAPCRLAPGQDARTAEPRCNFGTTIGDDGCAGDRGGFGRTGTKTPHPTAKLLPASRGISRHFGVRALRSRLPVPKALSAAWTAQAAPQPASGISPTPPTLTLNLRQIFSPRVVRLVAALTVLCPHLFAQDDRIPGLAAPATAQASALPAPVNLTAPPLARTATTAVLLWDRPAGGEAIESYQIFRDGILAGETSRLSFTARNLTPNRPHRFTVRSRRSPGISSAESDPVAVVGKAAGPVLNVRTLGARGDGIAPDTAAIRQAVANCPPGGTVLLPPGVYSVDHLELKSDMTLEIATGATLQFRARGVGDFPALTEKLAGPEGEVTVANFSLLTARDAKNLTITGGGRINGNGASWWPHRLEGPRPHLFKLVRCAEVFVQDVTLEDPPAWNTHALYVDRAVFSGLTFLKVSTVPGSSGDGLDPDSARDILIVGCRFGNQDDSIAIKSGSVSATRPFRQRPAENITVRDCLFDGTLAPGSRPLGIAIGSETSGGIRRVSIRDCEFRNASSVAYIKTNRERRGTVIEDVRVENCVFTNTAVVGQAANRAAISIDTMYYDPASPELAVALAPDTPVIRNVHFRNIAIEDTVRRGITLVGLAESPVRNLTFTDLVVSAPQGLHGRNLDGVELRNVTIRAREGPAFTWLDVQNRTLHSVTDAAVSRPAPVQPRRTTP